MEFTYRVEVCNGGYVGLVETWGSDQRIIESARMSTGKGFLGWDPGPCPTCNGSKVARYDGPGISIHAECKTCNGVGSHKGDKKLLHYLWNQQHATPFEMAGMTVEIMAPIMVFREHHRHRTQSYSELSARYTPLPDHNYFPLLSRLMDGGQNKTNKQGSGEPVSRKDAEEWLMELEDVYKHAQVVYESGLRRGIAKELARLPVPVGRFSRMRASANLRNWLAFLKLRCAPNAQWEIRECATAVAMLLRDFFPHTCEVAFPSLGLAHFIEGQSQ